MRSGKGRNRRFGRAALFVCIVVLFAAFLLYGCGNNVKKGAQLLDEGEVEEAVSAFEQVLEDKGSSDLQMAEAYRGLGMCYYELKQFDKAQESLEKAVDAGGEETKVLYHLIGVCAMQQEDYAAALSAFEKGISLPDEQNKSEKQDLSEEELTGQEEMIREMYFNRVVCYEKLYDWQQAYAAATEYLEHYPDDEQMQHEAEFLETR